MSGRRKPGTPVAQIGLHRRPRGSARSSFITDESPRYPISRLIEKEERPWIGTLTKILFSVGVGTMLVLLGVSYVYFVFLAINERKYCDSGGDIDQDAEHCVPCPENGICKDGKVECKEDYVYDGRGKCLKSEDVEILTSALRREIERLVEDIAGKYECGHVQTNIMNESMIKSSIEPFFRQYVSSSRWIDKSMYSKYDQLFGDAISSILEVEEDFRNIVILSKETTISDPKTGAVGNRTIIRVFYAKSGPRDVYCVLKLFIYSRLHYFSFAAVIFALILYIYLGLRRRRNRRRKIDVTVKEVRSMLRSKLTKASRKGDGNAWIPVSQVRDHLMSVGDRYLWPEVEKVIEKDSRIIQMPRRLSTGVQELTWQWSADIAL